MSWAKIDDGYDCNPKVLAVSVAARWLHLCSITYCRRLRRVDGRMSAAEVTMLTASQRVPRRCAQELIEAALWDALPEGIAVHHYSAYLPDQSRDRTAAWRGRHSDKAETKRDGHETVSRARLVPKPIPIPTPKPREAKASKNSARFAGAVDRIVAAWTEEVVAQYGSRCRPMNTPERQRFVRARLEQGYTEEQWRLVVGAWRKIAYNVEHKYYDLTLLGRDGAHFERFLQVALDAQPTRRLSPELTAEERGGEFRPIAEDFAGMRAIG